MYKPQFPFHFHLCSHLILHYRGNIPKPKTLNTPADSRMTTPGQDASKPSDTRKPKPSAATLSGAFPKIRGSFWGPPILRMIVTDSIFGSMLGSPYLGKLPFKAGNLHSYPLRNNVDFHCSKTLNPNPPRNY